MVRTKIVGVTLAAVALLGGTMAPARAATHPCDAAFEDPTPALACGIALDVFCDVFTPPHPWCH